MGQGQVLVPLLGTLYKDQATQPSLHNYTTTQLHTAEALVESHAGSLAVHSEFMSSHSLASGQLSLWVSPP